MCADGDKRRYKRQDKKSQEKRQDKKTKRENKKTKHDKGEVFSCPTHYDKTRHDKTKIKTE